MISHDNLVSNAKSLVDIWGFTPDDVLVHALPIYHVHGLFVALHCALLSGASTRFLQRFEIAGVLRALQGATAFMGVPTYYTRLLAAHEFPRPGMTLRLWISGSAPLLPETFAAFEQRVGSAILERYGMTEAGMITSNPLHGARLAGTVGKPLPGVSARARRDDGEIASAGEPGVLEIRGPNVFGGYWRNEEKTRASFTPTATSSPATWSRSRATGIVSIVGRQNDLIISGGLNVYPKEIEEQIDALAGVGESAVIGVPHPDFGEGVVAVVDRSAKTLNEADILLPLRERLAAFKVPKRIDLRRCVAAQRDGQGAEETAEGNLPQPVRGAAVTVRAFIFGWLVATAASSYADYRHIELPNGDVYDGEVEHDLRNGQGTYTWADGNRYVGQYVDDRMQGTGTYYWPDGRTYEGTFEKDLRQGNGLLRWPNGDRYEGEFLEDHITGRGVFVWANSDRYEGDFVGGERTGQGIYTWHNGERYEGRFEGDQLQGPGKFFWPDGRKYEGNFVAGKKSGTGTFEWPNGNRYVGAFANDAREGLGTFYWRDGTVYEGTFDHNKMQGFGVKRTVDGQAEFQQWRDGALVLSQPLVAVKSCRISIDGRDWMFQANTCINGLAHGRGPAASLDGTLYIPAAHIVLGHLVEGEVRPLRSNG